MASPLLSVPSAMISPAIIPAQPNDPGQDSRTASPLQSQDLIADFGSLLSLFFAEPESGQNIRVGTDPSDTETASSSDSAPAGLSVQMMANPAIFLLNPQTAQLVTNEKGAADQLSCSLDTSPARPAAQETAQAQLSGLFLGEGILANLEPGTNAALGSPLQTPDPSTPAQPAAGSALPQLPLPTQQIGENALAFSPLELPAASLQPKPQSENVERGKSKAESFASAREPLQDRKGQQISSEGSGVAEPEAVLSGGQTLPEKGRGEQEKSGSGEQDWQFPSGASSQVGIDPPRDSETVVPAVLNAADAQVAAHAEALSVPLGERGVFLGAREDGRGRSKGTGDGIEPNSQVQIMSQEKLFHGAERERPADAPSANAWSSTIERLAADISTHVRQGRQEVSMRLEPPELGNLHIDLLLDGDRLQARVTAEGAEAGNLIQTHLPELRQALQGHNLNLVNVQVDLGGWGGLSGGLTQGSSRQSDERRDWMPAMLQTSEGEQLEHPITTSLSNGAVSVWA